MISPVFLHPEPESRFYHSGIDQNIGFEQKRYLSPPAGHDLTVQIFSPESFYFQTIL